MRYTLPSAKNLLLAVGLAATAIFHAPFAIAQDANAKVSSAAGPTASAARTAAHKKAMPTAAVAATDQHDAAHRYFVEFHARNAESYGHMYVMYGEVNDRDEIIKSEIAGFYPAGDEQHCLNCSVTNWTVGHVVPVPSEIGASDGDLEEQYVLARFRVWIDAAQYRQLVGYIKERKAHKGPWNAFFNNCVTFGRDVAVFLNLNVPLVLRTPSVVMYPETVVKLIREANGVTKVQLPLKDAPGSLPPEVASKLQASAATEPAAEKEATEKEAAAAPRSKKRFASRRDEGAAPSSGAATAPAAASSAGWF
jgi:hypothetical protein